MLHSEDAYMQQQASDKYFRLTKLFLIHRMRWHGVALNTRNGRLTIREASLIPKPGALKNLCLEVDILLCEALHSGHRSVTCPAKLLHSQDRALYLAQEGQLSYTSFALIASIRR